MRRRILFVCTFGAAVAAAGAGFPDPAKPAADAGKAPAPRDGEYDFGNKVVAVSVPVREKDDTGGGYMEKARVRRLGDRYFITGRIPDMGPEYKALAGTVLWLPMSEVTQLAEYDSVEAARKVREEWDKAHPDK